MDGIQCNFSKAVNKLSGLELSHTFHDVLDDGLKVIQEQAQNNLRSSGIKASSSMIDGVLRDVNATSTEGMVYIRGDGYGNHLQKTDYRNQFHELGTRPRYVGVKGKRDKRGEKMDNMFKKGKKEGYRGRLTPTNFFTKAKSKIQEAEDKVSKELEERITDMINNGKKE